MKSIKAFLQKEGAVIVDDKKQESDFSDDEEEVTVTDENYGIQMDSVPTQIILNGGGSENGVLQSNKSHQNASWSSDEEEMEQPRKRSATSGRKNVHFRWVFLL